MKFFMFLLLSLLILASFSSSVLGETQKNCYISIQDFIVVAPAEDKKIKQFFNSQSWKEIGLVEKEVLNADADLTVEGHKIKMSLKKGGFQEKGRRCEKMEISYKASPTEIKNWIYHGLFKQRSEAYEIMNAQPDPTFGQRRNRDPI